MTALILRIALGTLGVGFIAWWLYITYLGLKAFFKQSKTNNTNNTTTITTEIEEEIIITEEETNNKAREIRIEE